MELGRQFSLYGAGVQPAFTDGATAVLPWPVNKGTKSTFAYDRDAVRATVQAVADGNPPPLEDVDTRHVKGTQPSVTKAGVLHYMGGAKTLYADQHNPGNRHPIVFEDVRSGDRTVLTGHHRGFAEHLQGAPLKAIVVRGTPTPRAKP